MASVNLDNDSDSDGVFVTQESNNNVQNVFDEAISDIELEDFMGSSIDSGNISFDWNLDNDGAKFDDVDGASQKSVVNSVEINQSQSQSYQPSTEAITSDEEIDVETFMDDVPRGMSTQKECPSDGDKIIGGKNDGLVSKSAPKAGPSRIAGAMVGLKSNPGSKGGRNVRSFKPPVPVEVMEDLQNVKFAATTNKKTKSALIAYSTWRSSHMETFDQPLECIVKSDFDNPSELSKENLCMALCKFITEVQKCNSEEYPPNSIKGLIMSFQRVLKSKKIAWKLLDESDSVFRDLFYVVDNVMKERIDMGLGTVKSADSISFAREEHMWVSGVLGEHSPRQLTETLLYVLGLNFALRGGREHKELRRPGFNPQFTIGTDGNGVKILKYQQDPKSKTHQGGLKCKYIPPRSVAVYAHPNRQRCPLRLYEKYIGLLPPPKKCKELYLHGKKKPLPNVWYEDRCWGINTVSATVKSLMEMAGINDGNFKNHSLRATSLTRMHQGNVPEQVMKEYSGHQSNAIRTYKHTSDTMREAASAIVQGHASDFDQKQAETKSTSSSVGSEDSGVQLDKVSLEELKHVKGSGSDLEDFEPSTLKLRTPLKRKRNSENLVTADSDGICSFVESMCSKRKFKRIKVNLEFIDSD